MKRFLTLALALVMTSGTFMACKSAGQRKKSRKHLTAAGQTAGSDRFDPAFTPGVDVTEAGIRGAEFVAVPDLETVHFDFDSYALQGESLDALKRNAAYLKDHPSVEILVAGHCDERGTIQYNLSLGQNRARAVRQYYIRLGVPGESVGTISYGEEQPTCSSATEGCWHKNRRAETRVRTATARAGSTTTDTP